MNLSPSAVPAGWYQFSFLKLGPLQIILSQAGGVLVICPVTVFIYQHLQGRLGSTLGQCMVTAMPLIWLGGRVSWRSCVLIAVGALRSHHYSASLSKACHLWDGCREGGCKLHPSFRGLTLSTSATPKYVSRSVGAPLVGWPFTPYSNHTILSNP